MKEYTIKINFSVESKHSDYENISIFAEELAEKIMEDENLIFKGDIEIVESVVNEIEDHNETFDRDEDFVDDDDEY